VRVFVAVFPPPEVQHAVAAYIESLKSRGPGVSWEKRDNLHFTMRFLGEIGEDGARRVIEAAREAASATPAFAASLSQVGAFPSPRRARVLWLGMDTGGPELVALAGRLDAALARRGWEPESRPFAAHLTIGRVREPGDWSAAVGAAIPPTRFRAEHLAVIRSQLNPKGSIYTVLENAPLAAPV
jgi:2'-5' RNA ligase